MKRIITASNRADDGARAKFALAKLGKSLTDVINAPDDESAAAAYNEVTGGSPVHSREEALTDIVQYINYWAKLYSESTYMVSKIPVVRDQVISYIEGQLRYSGHIYDSGSFDTYIIDDDMSFEEYEDLCRGLMREFETKDRDGLGLGGSWTGHHYKIGGVVVHPAIEDGTVTIEFGGY